MSKVTFYISWVENEPETLDSFTDHIGLLESDYDVEFIIDNHSHTKDFDVIARNIDDGLIFFVDYNLKSNTGEGLDGHEVIALIRANNKSCPIVFYSSKATEEELKELVKDYENVKCILREDLFGTLRDIADGSFNV
jgi:hypothetical protein